MRLPKQKIRTNLMICAGFSKAGVNGPGNTRHFTSTWRERRDSFLFCVILPKIWKLWTPGEQKLLFGGTIILGECSAVVRDTDESDTASPGLRAPAKCAMKPGRDFPTPISRPGQSCLWNKESQVAVGGFLPGQSLNFA